MPHRHTVSRPPAGLQRGVFLLEALMGILIFSLGILTLVAMQTAAISTQSDARYRIEAANLADQIVGEIWLNVDRTTAATTQASLATFQHNENTTSSCNFYGTTSANALVTTWVNTVTGAGTGLPGATAAMQQIVVNTAGGAYNKVTVTLCWQVPLDSGPHKHSLVSFVN